jgi:hypothetical protein
VTDQGELTIDERLDRLESQRDIARLTVRYCHGIDEKDLEKFLSIWHPDAQFLIPGGRGEFYGLDGLRRSQVVIAEVWRATYHWSTNHDIEFDRADRATGRSNGYAICVQHDGVFRHVGCTYHDLYERRSGTWLIARRLVDRHFVSDPVDVPLVRPT